MVTAITKEEFTQYVKVQLSGKTNMFDVAKVQELSGLPREKILDIMKNYSKYNKRWSKEEETKRIINQKLDQAQTLIAEAKRLAKSINLIP